MRAAAVAVAVAQALLNYLIVQVNFPVESIINTRDFVRIILHVVATFQ